MSDPLLFPAAPPASATTRNGFTVWLTGLSGAGKTTIAHALGPELERRGLLVEYLDGDLVRTQKGLGFSREDRDTNIERIDWVASRLTRHGAAVIVAAISPYERTRQRARELVEPLGAFIEVHVATTVETCVTRDVKGLYAKALAGELKGFTGVDDPYEAPSRPELRIETERSTPEEAAAQILAELETRGLTRSP